MSASQKAPAATGFISRYCTEAPELEVFSAPASPAHGLEE